MQRSHRSTYMKKVLLLISLLCAQVSIAQRVDSAQTEPPEEAMTLRINVTAAPETQIETHRDDQLLQTLNAGISAGQHEGGGKSLEIRRFGFNLDHGGVNGGLKVLVDDIQQNQSTQGH